MTAIGLAVRNEEKFLSGFRGTSGVAIWTIDGTGYCLALAWNIPKYRKLFKKSNLMSVGLLIDAGGRFDHGKEQSLMDLYKYLIVDPGRMCPGGVQNYGDFTRFSCDDYKSGYGNYSDSRFRKL
jgi:hypothetical protein